MKHTLTLKHLASLVVALVALPALAQHPAEHHANEVNTRVAGELYGNNVNAFTLRPYQVKLLPSEERFAITRSGMLPSELEFNRSSVGPLSPNGVLDYVTPRSPLQQAMKLPSPQLYNPAYELTLNPYNQSNDEQRKTKTGFEMSSTPPGQAEAESSALPALRPSRIAPLPTGQLSSGQLPSGQLSNRPESLPPAHTVTGTVRHGTLLLRRPAATQPTPPPQPKP